MIFVLIFDASEAFNLAVLRTPFFFSRIRSLTSLRPKETSEAFQHAIAGGEEEHQAGLARRLLRRFYSPRAEPPPRRGRYNPPALHRPPTPPKPAATSEGLPSPHLPSPPRGTTAPRRAWKRKEAGTAAPPATDVWIQTVLQTARLSPRSAPAAGRAGAAPRSSRRAVRRGGIPMCCFPSHSALPKGLFFPLGNLHFSPN